MILGRNRRGSYGAVLSTAMDDARPTSAADVGGGDRFDETENRELGRSYPLTSCDPPPPARLDAEIFRCNARYRIGRRPDPQVSPYTSSRGHNGKWTLKAALAGQNRGARNHRAGGALCAWRVCRIRVRKAVSTRCRSTD